MTEPRSQRPKSEDRVGELLRSLPREEASIGFNERVMRRLETASAEPSGDGLRLGGWSQPVLVAVAVVLAVAAGYAFSALRSGGSDSRIVHDRGTISEPARAESDRLERLRLEHRQLSDELDALRRLAVESQPVVPIRAAEDLEMLLDLRRLRPAASGSNLKPASFRNVR